MRVGEVRFGGDDPNVQSRAQRGDGGRSRGGGRLIRARGVWRKDNLLC
jgi:hypothetical protein